MLVTLEKSWQVFKISLFKVVMIELLNLLLTKFWISFVCLNIKYRDKCDTQTEYWKNQLNINFGNTLCMLNSYCSRESLCYFCISNSSNLDTKEFPTHSKCYRSSVMGLHPGLTPLCTASRVNSFFSIVSKLNSSHSLSEGFLMMHRVIEHLYFCTI